MNLDLTDLKLFIKIAESPSLTQGARRACLSPGAASMRIKSMEGELGEGLFLRQSKGLVLTAAGRRLLVHARKILGQLEVLKAEFERHEEQDVASMRMYVDGFTAFESTQQRLVRYLAEHAHIAIDLQARNPGEIVRGVREGAVDMGVVAGSVPVEGCASIAMPVLNYVVVLPRRHPLANTATLRLRDVLRHPQVGLCGDTALGRLIEEQARDDGSEAQFRIKVSTGEAFCRMVAEGVGIGVASDAAVQRYLRCCALVTRPLEEAWARQDHMMLVRHCDSMPRHVTELLSYLSAA
ncbi:LysR family transcriptional regulator [Pseudomonas entomophila]|uniref:LysR family transcriptional regulator n=1 Tax=Pseudomonas entomophila TaxID=312306 RepID=UPI001BCFBF4D|nr:LysR family transcriptional regulator [Pseudomonas entomophila]QVM90064.1 LysR family transcriptional regulator [Pseudomonas entomophila]